MSHMGYIHISLIGNKNNRFWSTGANSETEAETDNKADGDYDKVRKEKKNVMLHILDFVKNDYEIEIMFESKLDNHERRKIHNIVDKIGNADTILATADVTVPNIDIFNDIIKYNNYILRTESEGVVPNRTLCIYKEPPAHMYVVTHHDLRYEPEKPAKANKPNTELNVLANESNEQTHHKNEIKEVNETKMDEDNKIILVGSESSCDLHEGEGENNTKSANGHKENEVLSENVALNKETTDVHGENNIIKSKKNKSYHITKKGVIKYRMTKVKVDSKPLMADKKSKFRKVTTEVLAREKNPFLKSIMSVQKCDSNLLTKTDLKNQILEYFREFTSEKLYTEFKFLGSFDEVEAEAINEFIKNLWMCITDGDYLNDEILCIMKDAECGFAIGMHNNGSAL
ncbi:unnamed protein product [Diatraea saccharalis]|uniref:R3H domain-containing protein n=1 Tax=Diatraea saccharalis TaxID=40085 RepID=A0A9N9WJK3_9NEOP|nr:unnamed protein product [Diatraea saccharalis]